MRSPAFQDPVSASQPAASSASVVRATATVLPSRRKPAEDDAARAAQLDERELGHVAVGRGPLDDEGRAGAVEDDRRLGLPRVDERLELPRDVGGPRAGAVVGILLDDRAERAVVRHAVEELGAPAVRVGPAGHESAGRPEAQEPLDVGLADRAPGGRGSPRRR